MPTPTLSLAQEMGIPSNFHSIPDSDPLEDLSQVSSGAVKLKISTAIIIISAIYLLEMAIDFGKFSPEQIIWTLALHGTLLTTGLVLAIIERLSGHH